jgi:hypothetical protein
MLFREAAQSARSPEREHWDPKLSLSISTAAWWNCLQVQDEPRSLFLIYKKRFLIFPDKPSIFLVFFACFRAPSRLLFDVLFYTIITAVPFLRRLISGHDGGTTRCSAVAGNCTRLWRIRSIERRFRQVVRCALLGSLVMEPGTCRSRSHGRVEDYMG